MGSSGQGFGGETDGWTANRETHAYFFPVPVVKARISFFFLVFVSRALTYRTGSMRHSRAPLLLLSPYHEFKSKICCETVDQQIETHGKAREGQEERKVLVNQHAINSPDLQPVNRISRRNEEIRKHTSADSFD